jgi:hypothetical protein
MTRESSDVSIVNLPEEKDAQDTKKIVEKAGRRAYLMALSAGERELQEGGGGAHEGVWEAERVG